MALSCFLIFIQMAWAEATAQEVRDLEPFTGVGVSISADVWYTPGNTHEIRIEGDEDDVRELITEVRDGFLKIKYDDWRTRRSKLDIYITSRELEEVKISGSADFFVEESLNAGEVDLAVSGNGGIYFSKLEAEEVEVKLSGSGGVEIKSGSAEEMDAKISGSGKLMAESFEVEEFSAAISGSGGVEITATGELDAKISGSGKVYYHGNPRVNSVTSGSGKVASF